MTFVKFGNSCFSAQNSKILITLARFGPDGRQIEDRPGSQHVDYTIKTYLERENSRTMLRVNKLKLSSAGSYTVKVTNGNLTKMENFTLIIRSPPSVDVSVGKLF